MNSLFSRQGWEWSLRASLAVLFALMAGAALQAQAAEAGLAQGCTAATATNTSPISTADAKTNSMAGIHSQGFVRIEGIDQWVTIDGEHCDQPIILMVHGGPGNPNTPFAAAVYGAWAKDFTVVQWDQRGAGKTFGRNPDTVNHVLTVDQLTRDGVAVAEWAAQRLGQKKVILMGSSWGSVLAVHMAQRRPALFQAYIGTAQMVSARANMAAFYAKTLARTQAAGDEQTTATLTALGAPPWRNPRAFGVVRRASRPLEAARTSAPPAHWWQPAPAYATAQALADTEQGEDYSWLQFVGLKNDGMAATIDLPALGNRFAMPVYLLQGTEDLLTPPEVTRPYFDSLQAPDKAWVLVPLAGHDPNEAMLAAQMKVLKERVLPWLKNAS